VDRLRLDAAESHFGVDITDAEEAMALRSVNRNLEMEPSSRSRPDSSATCPQRSS
jgi:hypothetical protein